ncbi:hypothetical protein C9374_001543 [Naegleria lovaniensis]|uniref:PH domain-containing protein n=1 Tax=Naegleria lovaniensis TaxID=51637 RepID=A0AA88GRS1_NAELO|nr:uncharacterized protein C9374_001543 [Naegleria lovaniensis]KAG2387211.1 hypothetical protein C9374_001543 [Naegleria lovaniensis]
MHQTTTNPLSSDPSFFSSEDDEYNNDHSLPSLSGYLQQKAGFFGRWKKFWFVLSNGILYKFKSNKDTQPIEEYDISGTTSSSVSSQPQQQPQRILHNGKHVCGKEHSIALFFQEGSETLILLANDAQEHVQWMDALNRSLPKHLRLSMSTAVMSQDSSSNSSGSNSSLNGGLSMLNINNGNSGISNTSKSLAASTSSHHAFSPYTPQSRMESMLQVLEAVLDPTVISDCDGKIVGFNKAAEELFGWRKDEVLSKNVSILMPTMYAQHHDGYMMRFKKWQDKRLIGKPRRLLAKHKQGHNIPIEISLGEIPHEEGSNDNMAFVAVFRPSIEDPSHFSNSHHESMSSESPNYPYSSSANSSLESSPLSSDSKEDSFLYGVPSSSSPFGTKKAESVTTTTTSSFSLDQDVERDLHGNREKLDQRLSAFVTSMKSAVDSEYTILEKKFQLLQQQVNIVEQENERLFQQTEKQHEHIKLLEEELGVLQRNSEKFSLVQLLKNESTFKVFLEYCHKNNTSDLVMFYKEADEFRNKYSQIDGVIGTMEDEAKRIYENYLSDNSGKVINIPFDSKSNVKYHLSTPTCDMFDLAINDTLAILKEISFDKFCESGSGKATLQQLLL